MPHNQRYKKAKQITLIGGVTNILLGLLKLIGGVICHSHALVADGVHSFADVITDIMVIFASKYGSQDADAAHPYGHQRIETAATLLLSLLLILAGIGIAWDAASTLFTVSHEIPTIFSVPIAIVSIVVNEIFYHYTLAVGKHIRSDLLIANAWHHRSDAGASLIVLFGLLGSMYGWPLLDPLAAVIIGGLIIKMGISYGWRSVTELIDTAVDTQTLLAAEELIQSIPGVQKIHQLRSRRMGKDIFLDLHIQVSPWISVSEGHFIAQNVHYSLMKHNPEIKDVTVHVDPEDDETSSPSKHLPTRAQLEETWLNTLKTQYPEIINWTLHYIDGELYIDLIISEHFTNYSALQQEINAHLTKQPYILYCKFFKAENEF